MSAVFDEDYLEVYFDQYCNTCKHKDNPESEPPCDECLENPTNLNTHKPYRYEERDNTYSRK